MLCRANDEPSFSKAFHYFADALEHEEGREVRRKILSMYGGMGSFNDLVFHKDGKPLGKENDELDVLRRELYKQITESW